MKWCEVSYVAGKKRQLKIFPLLLVSDTIHFVEMSDFVKVWFPNVILYHLEVIAQ